jgi:hypothetical protein
VCGKTASGYQAAQSDARGVDVTKRPLHPEDVAATVYLHVGIGARNTALPAARAGRGIPSNAAK